nr:hypothetical protein BaRGS_024695 [Batillaria attramentaria]
MEKMKDSVCFEDLKGADVGQHEATSSTSKSDAAPSSASRPVRRRVTFSEEKAGDEVLPQLACKPPPILFRQHSTESSCSTSSGESVLAFALDPESPTLSEASSPFDFPSGLHGNCFAFPRDGTDLVLMAEGVKFHVHRSFLLSVCPMLRAHLRETSACQVLLHDKRAGDVLDFLRLLYPGQSQVVNDRNLEGILDLAFQFGADSVQRICITYLQGLAEFRHLCSHQPPVPDLHHRGPNHHNDRSDATTITLKPFGARSQRAPAYTAEHQYSKSSSYDHEETVGSAFSSPETAEDRFIDSGRSRNALEARTGLHSNRSGAEDHDVTYSMCDCAVTMADRVISFLLLASRHGLEDIYQLYVDVASEMVTDELKACPRYRHLPSAIRQDVVEARVSRLEYIVSSVSVKKGDLKCCSKTRHSSHRFPFKGEICLRHMMQNLEHVL